GPTSPASQPGPTTIDLLDYVPRGISMSNSRKEPPRRSSRRPGSSASRRMLAWAAAGASAAMAPATLLAQTAEAPAAVTLPGVSVTAPPPADTYKVDTV